VDVLSNQTPWIPAQVRSMSAVGWWQFAHFHQRTASFGGAKGVAFA